MMRFKTGSTVEVFSTREVPSGSWYLAEIIHGNGHYYTVKYKIGAACEVFDRVPRKAIRPCCPPPTEVMDCTPGDVVEVFHEFSWRMATVLRALQTGWILVRLLGSSHELEVSEDDARPRLFWEDGDWNVIGKGTSNCEERQNVPSRLKNHSSRQMEITSISLKNSYFPCSHTNGIQEVQDVPKSLKRKFKSCNPENEAQAVQNKKIRVKGKYRRRNQRISILRPSLPVKVDAVASSRAKPVKKCSRAVSFDSRGVDSITSSVASCSSSMKNACQNFLSGPYQENDDYNSDAESFCPNRLEEENCVLPSDKKVSEEVHRIEMHAYRSIIGALYASGPLSWEQETLLTDLRDSLHISNDEHLMELRSLVSGNSCMPNS